MRYLMIGITFVCLIFGLMAWDRQLRLQADAHRKSLHAKIMAIVGNGTVYVRGNPGKSYITVKRQSFDDDDLKAILQLKDVLDEADGSITNLDLSGTAITDDGVSLLADLNSLEVCDLDQTSVSDTSIDVLERLPNLENLSVMTTRVTDERLSKLSLDRPDLFIVGKSKY